MAPRGGHPRRAAPPPRGPLPLVAGSTRGVRQSARPGDRLSGTGPGVDGTGRDRRPAGPIQARHRRLRCHGAARPRSRHHPAATRRAHGTGRGQVRCDGVSPGTRREESIASRRPPGPDRPGPRGGSDPAGSTRRGRAVAPLGRPCGDGGRPTRERPSHRGRAVHLPSRR